MALYKNEENKGSIIFDPQTDFKIVKEFEKYYVITVNGPEEEPIPVDMWSYALYFFSNIQKKSLIPGLIYIDGLRIDKYMEYYCQNNGISNAEKYIFDITSYGFQKEFEEEFGAHLNVFALYGLSMYIKEIIERRLCILFKPTIKDTLEEIADANNIQDIRFSTVTGNHSTDNPIVKDLIIKALEECKNDDYVFDRIERKVDVFTKEYGQIEFVRYISEFFHTYFKIKRRKNCYISSTEYRIICYLLYFLDYTPALVQETRVKQLLNSKVKYRESLLSINIPGFLETDFSIEVEFIPYANWKGGRIDPLRYQTNTKDKDSTRFTLNMGGETEKIKALVEIFKKVIQDSFTK